MREPELIGQTVVVIGGSAGIGLETARRASHKLRDLRDGFGFRFALEHLVAIIVRVIKTALLGNVIPVHSARESLLDNITVIQQEVLSNHLSGFADTSLLHSSAQDRCGNRPPCLLPGRARAGRRRPCRRSWLYGTDWCLSGEEPGMWPTPIRWSPASVAYAGSRD